jgi:hypothetical protein
MRRLAVAAALVGGAGWLLLTAGAVGGIEVGWWRQGSPSPPPPTVPPGGLWVSSSPAGDTAVSALRFELAPGESAPIVTLHVGHDDDPAGAGIAACRTAGPGWRPAQGGAWSSRPAPDCAAGVVTGRLSADGSLMAFDLAPLAVGDTVDVVLFAQPAANPVPDLGVGVPVAPRSPAVVDATFSPPAPKDVLVHTALPSSPPSPSPLPAPAGAAPVPVAEGATPPPATNPARAANPLLAGPTLAAPGPAPRPTVSAALRPASSRHAEVVDRRNRMIAAFVLLDLAVWWWRLSSNAAGSRRPRAPALR